MHIETTKEITIKIRKELTEYYPIDACIMSSVGAEKKELKELLKKLYFFIELDDTVRIPVKNKYLSPETLGNDRLANITAANSLFPEQNVLVVDTGTCLKFDYINSKGEYTGGAISPGLFMRYKALHKYTQRLPLLKPEENIELIGDSTANSIHSGVVNGMIAEINGIIERYEKIADHLQVILCGGDARYFSNHLKNNIFAAPYLTLQGLNEILLYNQ